MFFHFGIKKKVLSRGVVQRLRCPRCGYVTHDILCFKSTLSFVFIPAFSTFTEAIRCHSCGKLSRGKEISSNEAQQIARSKAFGVKDYILGNIVLIIVAGKLMMFILFLPIEEITNTEKIMNIFSHKEKHEELAYTFYDGCTKPETGNLYIADLHAYQPDKFPQGQYGVMHINAGQFPRYYNANTKTYEEHISFHYALSNPVYTSKDEAIKAIQHRDHFADNYFNETQAAFTPIDVFRAECQKAFKGIRLSLTAELIEQKD